MKRISTSLFISSFFCAVFGYLPPPGPFSLLLFNYPLPFRFFSPYLSFLITFFLIFLLLNVLLLFVVLPYSEVAFEGESYLNAIMSRLGLPNYEIIAILFSIFAFIVLILTSSHYLPLGFFLFFTSLSLTLYPVEKRKMGEEPDPIVVRPSVSVNKTQKIYSWEFPYELGEEPEPLTKPQHLVLDIDLDTLNKYAEENPSRQRLPDPGDLNELVNKGIAREVEVVASEIRETTRKNKFPSYVEILNTICFVQSNGREKGMLSIEYKKDEEVYGIPEYWAYPIETLFHQAGDCECKTILAVALFKVLGKKAIFLFYRPKEEGKPGHVALGIEGADSFPPGLIMLSYEGKNYFFCELTKEGWQVGEIPEAFRGTTPEVYTV